MRDNETKENFNALIPTILINATKLVGVIIGIIVGATCTYTIYEYLVLGV